MLEGLPQPRRLPATSSRGVSSSFAGPSRESVWLQPSTSDGPQPRPLVIVVCVDPRPCAARYGDRASSLRDPWTPPRRSRTSC